MNRSLHIIAFNVPYPADYGGVVDVFYKIVALYQQGIQIHLHCFDYGRGHQDILNYYCASVNYYPRVNGHKAISRNLPYIVASRKNEALLENLLQDDYPILMEGIHCTYLLNDSRFKNRKCFVRLHNIEYRYYQDLGKTAGSWIRKLYYWNESKLLAPYESKILENATCWGISANDIEQMRVKWHPKNLELLPLFLPDWEMKQISGEGSYCLYHGDLSVDANEKAAIWLLEKVFLKIKIPFVIAGKNPSKKLIDLAHVQNHTCIVANPTDKEMQDMIVKAQVHLVPAFTSTGIKVKLLNALCNGRHCIANRAALAGTGLDTLCTIANTADEFKNAITKHFENSFSKVEKDKRTTSIRERYNNEKQAAQIIQWIWSNC